jgi:hypothetical protein
MKNLKTTMIGALLMFAAVGEVAAQEKYEYAIVTLNKSFGAASSSIEIYRSDNQQVEKVSKAEDVQRLFKKLEEFTNQDWEVYQSTMSLPTGSGESFAYFLRKKKI